MKKVIILMSILLVWATSLYAQITREQADAIVLEHVKGVREPCFLYVNVNAVSEGGITITTLSGETIKAKYACWVYFLNEYSDVNSPAQRRYLFVKEDTGSLLEVITSKDFGPSGDFSAWQVVKTPTGFATPKENDQSLYPNPVDDWLTLPCNGKSARVEIYDLKGTCLFSGTLSDKATCRINVSFLSAGIYMVNVDGKMFQIIKK